MFQLKQTWGTFAVLMEASSQARKEALTRSPWRENCTFLMLCTRFQPGTLLPGCVVGDLPFSGPCLVQWQEKDIEETASSINVGWTSVMFAQLIRAYKAFQRWCHFWPSPLWLGWYCCAYFYGEWVKTLTKVMQKMKLGPESSGRYVAVCFFWAVSEQSYHFYCLLF